MTAAGNAPGSLCLLSRHVQWVGPQQMSVLLLQSTLPDQLLTADMLVRRGRKSQRPYVC